MSTTPRTDESTLEAYCRFDQGGIYDAETRGHRDGRFVEADFARQLEAELNESVPLSDVKPLLEALDQILTPMSKRIRDDFTISKEALATFFAKHPDLK